MRKSTPILVLSLAIAVALGACQTGSAQEASGQGAGAKTCGGSSGATCEAESYCKTSGSGSAGVCMPKPQTCPMIYLAVCGTDGKTYPNECHAAQHGVNVAHTGACTTS